MAVQSHAHHALFPGTFDPVTRGHVDIVERARQLFGRVTIAVAHNPDKKTLFGPEERVELLREATRELGDVEVTLIDGLVVDACAKLGADVIVRGVRSGTDFDYEVDMARTNREMLPQVETILLAPSPAHAHVSSTLVRQILAMGGDASAFVPAGVARVLKERRSGHRR
jgi:pantetheine-phosphate adenylyltransferase